MERRPIVYYLVNTLTAARSLLIYAAISINMVTGETDIPIGLVYANGLIDMIDGRLARHFGVTSLEGRKLDATGDSLSIGAFVGLIGAEALPANLFPLGGLLTAVTAAMIYPSLLGRHSVIHREGEIAPTA